MEAKLRKRAILDKVERQGDLNLDGRILVFVWLVEQDAFLQFMGDDLMKQRTMWRVRGVSLPEVICSISIRLLFL